MCVQSNLLLLKKKVLFMIMDRIRIWIIDYSLCEWTLWKYWIDEAKDFGLYTAADRGHFSSYTKMQICRSTLTQSKCQIFDVALIPTSWQFFRSILNEFSLILNKFDEFTFIKSRVIGILKLKFRKNDQQILDCQ